MSNEDVILQQDRNTARELNQLPGVDGHQYNTQKLRELAKSYGKACAGGAAIGALASAVPTFGFGALPGAALGCAAGIGLRVYGIGIDTFNIAMDKFDRSLKNDINGE